MVIVILCTGICIFRPKRSAITVSLITSYGEIEHQSRKDDHQQLFSLCSYLLRGGVAATDIPRLPELITKGTSGYQPPRKWLGLDRWQMHDIMVAATEAVKIQTSLSSRRHRRHFAQMKTVKAGGCN